MTKRMVDDGCCSCGAVTVKVTGAPLFRMYCHCSICQRFNEADFADVTVFSPNDVILPPEELVEYKTYKPPPSVQRGKCVACQQPAIELFSAPLFPSMVMVPSAMFGDSATLPEPCGHLFYEGRVRDAADELPRYSGFIRSQLKFFKHFTKARLFRPS